MLKGKMVRALGTMSGTSLDGVDAAVVVTDGVEIGEFGETAFQAYSDEQREVLRGALGRWQNEDVSEAAEVVETVHAQVLAGFEAAELVGFHGQTLAHDPAGRGTHQVGDGGILAEILQTPVVWDFRSADVQLGGQGAPLAPFYHFALAKWMNARDPVCFLNLGGVGNVTWVDPSADAPEADGALLAFDTGPANAPINDVMMDRFGLGFDEGGEVAARGEADEGILSDFLKHPYFFKMPPKSLDRNDFDVLVDQVSALPPEDAVATVTTAAAFAVGDALQHMSTLPSEVLVTGGGRKNETLMKMLAAILPCSVVPVEDKGLDGDMLEAQAFAFLAVRVAKGLPTSCPSTTGGRAAVSGGTLSVPKGLAADAVLKPDE